MLRKPRFTLAFVLLLIGVMLSVAQEVEARAPIDTERIQKVLQTKLATSEEKDLSKRVLLWQTLIESIVHDDKKNELVFTGAQVSLGQLLKPDEIQNFLSVKLQGWSDAIVPGIKVNVEGIRVLSRDDNPYATLQEHLVTELKKDDCLLWATYDAEGIFQLQGFIGSKSHLEAIRAFMDQQPEGKPRPGLGRGPDGKPRWDATHVKIDWPFAPARFQAALARSDNSLLRQTRVDRITFVYTRGGTLDAQFKGVCAVLGQERNQVLEGLVNKKALPALLTPLLPQDIAKVNINANGIVLLEGKAHPVLVLMKRFNEDKEKKWDQVLLRGATYDEQGTLQLEGMVGSAAYLDKIDTYLKATSPDHPWSRKQVRLVADWPYLPSKIQAQMAERDVRLLKQTRLDRIFFSYTPSGTIEMHFQGICIHDLDELTNQSALTKPLKELLAPSVDLPSWEVDTTKINTIQLSKPKAPRKEPDGDEHATCAVNEVPPDACKTVSIVQESVARNRKLDGTLVCGYAYFDKSGALCLTGWWLGESQREELLHTARASFQSKESTRPLLSRGLLVKKEDFQASGTDQVLLALRQWTANHVEDTWLERLFFNADGDLELNGVFGKAQAGPNVFEEVEKRLIMAGELLGSRMGVALNTNLQLPAGGFALGDALRQQFDGDDPAWDGLLVDRAYYDPEGTYILSGLVDSEQQLERLKQFEAEFSQKEGWKSLTGKEKELRDWSVVPVKPMLDGLGIVLPDHPIFDGIRLLDRAYHDPHKRLVLPILLVRDRMSLTPGMEETQIQQLLAEHPIWKRRVASGLVLKIVSAKRPDLGQAESHLLKAIRDLVGQRYQSAWERIQLAILHNPKDSTAWFLSAWFNFVVVKNKEHQLLVVKRDLRRMLLLERSQNSIPYIVRLRRIEPLQQCRGTLNDLAAEMKRAIAAGVPPLRLTDLQEPNKQGTE